MMHRWLLLAAIVTMAAPGFADLRVSDQSGKRPVTRVSLDSLKGTRILRMDVDGDGALDTLRLYFEMESYRLAMGPVGEEIYLGSLAPENVQHNYMDIATGYVAGTHKPALLVYFNRGVAMGDHLKIIDVLNTTTGKEPRFLYDSDAGFADGPVVVTPGMIEIHHFRGYLEARYLWDGKKYIEQKGVGE